MTECTALAAVDPAAALDRAAGFIWRNARLLERRLFEAQLRRATRAPALAALRAYQNPDGGFGHALHPDLRGPHSQPLAVAFALRALDVLDAFDDPMLEGTLDFLTRIARFEGGVPEVLPPAADYPCAPRWEKRIASASSLRPTAELVGLLRKHGVVHPWVDLASGYCWRAIGAYVDPPAGAGEEPPCFDTLMPALAFLEHADEPGRAAELLARIGELILEWDLVTFDPFPAPDARTPLDWAPTPQCFARRLFTAEQVDRHRVALSLRQSDDGGWRAAETGPTPAAALEWRGVRTLDVLRTLRAYGAQEG